MTELAFPPLLYGEAAMGSALAHAARRAAEGCDAGLVAHCLAPDRMSAAMVLAPEVPLSEAMAMLPLCGVGFQNALGALAPPEVAVHLDWDGGIRLNGATCGQMRVAASGRDAKSVPDWLVVGFELRLWPPEMQAPGDRPDETALYAEGCADVDASTLVEAWARHTLNWIDTWEDAGNAALHAEWKGLVHGLNETTHQDGRTGVFLGVDERFGMLLRQDETTHLIQLTILLEAP